VQVCERIAHRFSLAEAAVISGVEHERIPGERLGEYDFSHKDVVVTLGEPADHRTFERADRAIDKRDAARARMPGDSLKSVFGEAREALGDIDLAGGKEAQSEAGSGAENVDGSDAMCKTNKDQGRFQRHRREGIYSQGVGLAGGVDRPGDCYACRKSTTGPPEEIAG